MFMVVLMRDMACKTPWNTILNL